jgi:hypothetical protein
MTSRVALVLWNDATRRRAIEWISKARPGARVELKPPQRSLPQNNRMWAMLTDIVTQSPQFNGGFGRRYTTNQAKIVFLHACGQEIETVPTLDGAGIIPYGKSSSDLTVGEMTDLIEFMFAWGAEQSPPIVWSDPKERRQRQQEHAA